MDGWSIQLALVRCGIAATDSPAFIHQVRRLERSLRIASHGKADSIKQLLDWHDNGRKVSEEQVVLSTKIKFRKTWTGASILDTMQTVIEVDDRRALVAQIQTDYPMATNENITILPAGYDERIGWDAHYVTLNGSVLGYVNQAVEAIDLEAEENEQAESCNRAIALIV